MFACRAALGLALPLEASSPADFSLLGPAAMQGTRKRIRHAWRGPCLFRV